MTTPAVLAGGGVAATVVLDEYTPAGVFVQSIPMPNVKVPIGDPAGNRALVFSGTQNNDGAITVSGNNQYFVLAGYNQTAGAPAALGRRHQRVTVDDGRARYRPGRLQRQHQHDHRAAGRRQQPADPLGVFNQRHGHLGRRVERRQRDGQHGRVLQQRRPLHDGRQLHLDAAHRRQHQPAHPEQLQQPALHEQQRQHAGVRGVNKIGTGLPAADVRPVEPAPIVQEPGFADTDSPNPAAR